MNIVCDYFGGVFANFQAYRGRAISLWPTTSSMGTASQISFKSSSESFTAKEPMLVSRFLTLVVPV